MLIATAITITVGLVVIRVRTSHGIVDTKTDKARYEVQMLSDVVEDYRKEYGRYPSNEEGLLELVRVGQIRKVPTDPWSHAYQYRFPGWHSPKSFDLWSYGADGQPGGSGVDKDIGNWDMDA